MIKDGMLDVKISLTIPLLLKIGAMGGKTAIRLPKSTDNLLRSKMMWTYYRFIRALQIAVRNGVPFKVAVAYLNDRSSSDILNCWVVCSE